MSTGSESALILLLIATVGNGLLAGLSLNKSVVELPAGKRMGALDFSRFSREADLRNGLPYYAGLGVATPVLTVAAIVWTIAGGAPSSMFLWLAVSAGILSVGHLATAGGAAPNMLRVGKLGDDERALNEAYSRFRQWQTARAILQVAAFVVVVAMLGSLT